jgi:hypothetical protein
MIAPEAYRIKVKKRAPECPLYTTEFDTVQLPPTG